MCHEFTNLPIYLKSSMQTSSNSFFEITFFEIKNFQTSDLTSSDNLLYGLQSEGNSIK